MEVIEVPTRGNLPQAIVEFAALAPDAVLGTIEHDDGCPVLDESDRADVARDCTCEIVFVHVEGYVPPEVAS